MSSLTPLLRTHARATYARASRGNSSIAEEAVFAGFAAHCRKPRTGSRILQWLSSVVGVAAITQWYVRAVHRPGPTAISSVIYFWRRTALQVIVLIATAAGLLRALEPSVGFNSFHGRAYLGTTTGVSTFVCLYVVGGVAAAACESRAKS